MSRRRLHHETLEKRLVLTTALELGENFLEAPALEAPEFPAEEESGEEIGDQENGDPGQEMPEVLKARHFVSRLRLVDAQEGQRERSGMARFHLNRDGDEIRFQLTIPGMTGLENATLRLGEPGSDGAVAVTLISVSGSAVLESIGIRGRINADSIQPSDGFDGTLESLVEQMRDGNTYVQASNGDQLAEGDVMALGIRPRHNPANKMDVDGDKNVTPRDAIHLVNWMNERGAGFVGLPDDANKDFEPPYYDVSGDNVIAPHDLLELVNYMNNRDPEAVSVEEISETVRELVDAIDYEQLELPSIDLADVTDIFEEGGRFEELLDRVEDRYEEIYDKLAAGGFDEVVEQVERIIDEFDTAPYEEIYEQVRDKIEPLVADAERLADEAVEWWRNRR